MVNVSEVQSFYGIARNKSGIKRQKERHLSAENHTKKASARSPESLADTHFFLLVSIADSNH